MNFEQEEETSKYPGLNTAKPDTQRLKSQSQKSEFGVWKATKRHHIYHIKLLEVILTGSKIDPG